MPKLACPDFVAENEVTPEQLDFFDRNGVIMYRNFISKEMVQLILSEVDRIEKQWLAEGRVKVNGTLLKFGVDGNGNKIIQRHCFLSLFSDVLHELLQDKRIHALTALLYPYEGRVGENEKDGMVMNHYLRVPNGTFSKMGWHTDSPRDLFLGQKIM